MATKTQEAIAWMLGQPLGESTNTYEERLQVFLNEEPVSFDAQFQELTVSAFKFWASFLDLSEEWDDKFSEFCEANDLNDWRGGIDGWFEHLSTDLGLTVSYHIYDSSVEPMFENTYNHENMLTHDALFATFYIEEVDQHFIALSMHRGGDPRNRNYSGFRIFENNSEEALGPFEHDRIEALVDLKGESGDPWPFAALTNCGGDWEHGNHPPSELFAEAWEKNQVEFDEHSELPDDDQHVYWVLNHDYLDDGPYYRGHLIDFQMAP